MSTRLKPALLEAYESLLKLAIAQQAALEADDLEAFAQQTTQRDRCFAALQMLESEAASLSPTQREELRTLTRQILTVDDALEIRLSDRMVETRQEISRLQPGIQALHAYVQESDHSAFFIDRNQ